MNRLQERRMALGLTQPGMTIDPAAGVRQTERNGTQG
jgi:hypothetical protein